MAPTSQAAYNAGTAWDAAHERARAANALSRALDRGQLSPDEVEEASRRLAELTPSLGKLSLNAPGGATVTAGELEAPIPGTLYVDPGTHRLRARTQDGEVVERTVDVRAGQSIALTFEAEAPPEPTTSSDPAPATPAAPQQDREPTDSSASRLVGYGLIGVGAAALGAGIYLNVRGVSANREFEDSGYTDPDAQQRAVDMRTGALIAYGASAVLGGVGLVLIVTSDGTSAQASVGPGSLTLSGRF